MMPPTKGPGLFKGGKKPPEPATPKKTPKSPVIPPPAGKTSVLAIPRPVPPVGKVPHNMQPGHYATYDASKYPRTHSSGFTQHIAQ